MINAGAILTTSLVAAPGPADRFARIHDVLCRFAGRTLDVDEATFASERETGDRNRALAYLMRAAGSLTEPPDEVVDTYFRQCSVLVTVADIATMAATLANGGVNPGTGERVVGERAAGHVLTVMATCGMYDYSGEWQLRAGLPAKSVAPAATSSTAAAPTAASPAAGEDWSSGRRQTGTAAVAGGPGTGRLPCRRARHSTRSCGSSRRAVGRCWRPWPR